MQYKKHKYIRVIYTAVYCMVFFLVSYQHTVKCAKNWVSSPLEAQYTDNNKEALLKFL